MAHVSKKTTNRVSEDPGTPISEANGADVFSDIEIDISPPSVERGGRSTAHVYLTLLILAGIVIVAMMCLMALMQAMLK